MPIANNSITLVPKSDIIRWWDLLNCFRCPTCQQALEDTKKCKNCESSTIAKATSPSSHHKQADTQTHRHIKKSDNNEKITRTTKTFTEEEIKRAQELQKISLELQKSVSTDTWEHHIGKITIDILSRSPCTSCLLHSSGNFKIHHLLCYTGAQWISRVTKMCRFTTFKV